MDIVYTLLLRLHYLFINTTKGKHSFVDKLFFDCSLLVIKLDIQACASRHYWNTLEFLLCIKRKSVLIKHIPMVALHFSKVLLCI